MKTIVLFGSPRNNGNTKAMLDAFLSEAYGSIEIINVYEKVIYPCTDCRYCYNKKECRIKDDMQDIYTKIDEADNIVIASPIYFNSLPGPLKTLIDRFQVYWAAHIRKDFSRFLLKKGAVLLCGGAPTFENQFLGAELVVKGFFHELNTELIGIVTASNTDKYPVNENINIKDQSSNLCKLMRQ